MGTWGPAIFSDDLACDVRDEYTVHLDEGKSGEEATKIVLQVYYPDVRGTEEESVFWFALALTQWKKGRLLDDVRSQALSFIDNGADLKRWSEPGNEKVSKKRMTVLEKLKETLLSPMPPAKKPRQLPTKVPVKPGDVFEIPTEKGAGYFQCVRESRPQDCEVIRVLPGVYPDGGADLANLVANDEVFFIQFPLEAAIKKKLVRHMGHYDVPSSVTVPKYSRRKHLISGAGWQIVDNETLVVRPVRDLSNEERGMSPHEIWNVALLAQRIAEGWRPEDWV